MTLDVLVRMVDQTSRPARDATAALEKFGTAANRITSRVAGLARASRGLATALREVKAADGATDRATASTTRLRGSMAAIGPAARTASTGLDRFTRSADRLATAARKATGDTRQLQAALATAAPAGGFASSAQAQLRSVIALQRQALGNMRLLNAGSGGGSGRGGRRGMGSGHGGGGVLPGIALAFQPSGHEALHGIYEQATSLQDAIVKMHLNGLSDSEIASVRAKAAEVAAANKSTTPLSNINAIMEARLALGGDLQEALSTAGEMSKMRTVLGFSLGKDRAKAAEDATYDALRTAEVRNVVNDPARRAALFKGMTAAAIASNGRITPKQWHSTAIYGRSATQGLSDEFTDYRLPFLMQEMANGGKGGPAGTALQAMFRAIPMAIQKSSNIGAWRSIGMLNEDKVEHGRMGDRMLPGAIKSDKLAISDPDKFVYEVMDRLAKRDKLSDIAGKDRGAMIQALAQFFGTATAQSAVDIMGLQRRRMDNFERTLKQVEDSGTLLDQINETASQSVANLNAQMDALKGNIGSSVIPAFGSLVDGTTRFVGVMNRVAGLAGGNGNDPVKGGGGASLYQLGLLGGGGMLGIAKLAASRPWLARLLAGGASAAATGHPAGALLGPTLLTAAQRLAGLLPGAVRTGLVAGIRGGIVTGLAYEGGKALIRGALSFIPGPTLAPDKQRRADADRREWDGASIFAKPGLIYRDIVGGRAGDYLPGGRLAPTGTGVPIAGARAFGGAVGSGKSYLVGERGPEIFTPGLSGAISTHAATKLALSGGGSASAGSDDASAHEIRYMSFALVSAVDGVTRAVDRLGQRAMLPSDMGVGGGSGGSGAGRGGSGRRAFGARMGGSGDGVALPDGASGPRVGLGRFGRAGRGGYSEFDSKAPAIMGGLMKKYGLTHEQAAGVVGNLGHESGAFTAYHEGGQAPGRGGVGWAQWTGPRRRAFERWTAAHKLDPTSDDASWRFLTEGDPETAGAIAAVKRTHSAHDAMVSFERRFERAGVKAYGSRDKFAARAMGMSPVDGVAVPDSYAKQPAPSTPDIPDFLAERARRRGARDRAAEAARTPVHTANTAPSMHVGAVHIAVHPHPHQDGKQIASAVHERFQDAVRSQLSDGAFA